MKSDTSVNKIKDLFKEACAIEEGVIDSIREALGEKFKVKVALDGRGWILESVKYVEHGVYLCPGHENVDLTRDYISLTLDPSGYADLASYANDAFKLGMARVLTRTPAIPKDVYDKLIPHRCTFDDTDVHVASIIVKDMMKKVETIIDACKAYMEQAA